jgi:glycine cleavage system H protein
VTEPHRTVATWAGCAVPSGLHYDLAHDTWARLEGGEVWVGMTDVAQTRCGRLVQLSWKPAGRRVRRGRPLSVIESAKWVGPFVAPLTGVVVANNAGAFALDVALANRDPYGAGWMYRLAPERLAEELPLLADAEAALAHYRRLIEEEGIRCFRCAD